MKSRAWDVVVIGAGANGLVAAAALGQAGLRVLLLEREAAVGGQARVVEFAPGFRAAPFADDPGWLPDPIAHRLGLGGLERAPTQTVVSVVAEPGKFLTLSRSPRSTSEAIATLSPTDAAKWPVFVARLRKLAGFLEALYMYPAPDVDLAIPGELLPLLDLGMKYRALGRPDMTEMLRALPSSVWDLLDEWFECAPLKAAVATGGIQGYQQGPRSGGTGFVLLHHLVGAPAGAVRGRAPWRRGPGAFTEAAEAAARRRGVAVRTGAIVARILVRDDAVTGVALADGDEIVAPVVLSTASPAQTLLDWVDPVWLDPEFLHAVGNIRHRGCTAIVLYALDPLPHVPGLANEALDGPVSLTSSLVEMEKAADAAKYGKVPDRPHVEITVPSRLWPALAADGKHVMVARAHYAPYRLRDDGFWDVTRTEALAESVTATIEAVVPEFRTRILHRVAWSPRDLEERYSLREGASSQGELGLDQILFMRPVAGWARHATPIAGLYLGGVGTHPGPGVLGGAGWLAARRMIGDRRLR